MNSQKRLQHPQGLHGSTSGGVLELREVETCSHPTPEATSNWQLLANEKLVLTKGVSLDKQATLNGRTHVQQKTPNTEEFNGNFGGSFYQNVKPGLFTYFYFFKSDKFITYIIMASRL